MKTLKRLGATLATLPLLTGGLVALTAEPAAAASGSLKVCNSADSYGKVVVFVTGTSAEYPESPGSCAPWLADTSSNTTLVDTSPPEYSPRTYSYKYKKEGGSYGPCHNYFNHTSDPPSTGGVVYVKNYRTSECHD